nr:hypothetical protein [Tanacetum cinerariifolium]
MNKVFNLRFAAEREIWEELEEQRLNGPSLNDKYMDDLVNLGLEGLLKDVSGDEAAEQAAHLRSQIYILWGTLLYERSVMEFKMDLSAWEPRLKSLSLLESLQPI